ncbi:hypothetical protein N0V94_002094 [Neodidymelliopsis sp. IMI 364377]|nr:hypothetical protein N0V94_002094 [Neodidymelliopsis sp. IMI 364377]
MPPKAPPFGSQDYWDQRFAKNPTPFDWLSEPTALDPFVGEGLRAAREEEPRILHVGCGSSLLSQHLKTHVKHAQQVHNVDYSEVVIDLERKRDREQISGGQREALMRWDAVNLLNHKSLLAVCGLSEYSIVVDKSTSDAISCADDVICPLPYGISTRSADTARRIEVEPKEIPVHPLQVMAVHLALVTKPGARWISLSYSSERYPFLEGQVASVDEDGTAVTGIPDPRLLWTVTDKQQIEAKEQENGSGNGVTHRPKVYHWIYVLQRTNVPLYINSST